MVAIIKQTDTAYVAKIGNYSYRYYSSVQPSK